MPPSQTESPLTVVEMATTETPSKRVAEEDEDENVEKIEAEMEEEMEEEEENGVSEYEKTREKRMKENRERMQKLGIFDASLQLKSAVLGSKSARKRKAQVFKNSPVKEVDFVPRPARRSSRLQNVTPISYAEEVVEKKGKSSRSCDIYHEVGSKPEVYTEEHDKLLGECNMDWTLFVDGYGKDGKRIYDPVRGKTCHQCRQKTMGHRTSCNNCNLVQGQFCGDCLYMRYGEHVLEANRNPDWVCPPCRGICNCSLCRQAKGWAPTGPLYRKIKSLGYKSVAHYLFQTRRSQTDGGNEPQAKNPSESALPTADNDLSVKDDLAKVIAHQSETDSGKNQSEKGEKKYVEDCHSSEKSGVEQGTGDDDTAEKAEVEMNAPACGTKVAETDCNPCLGISVCENVTSKNSKADLGNITNEDELQPIKGMLDQDSITCINTPDKVSSRKRSRVIAAPSPDSIAGRLRLRRSGGLFSIKST